MGDPDDRDGAGDKRSAERALAAAAAAQGQLARVNKTRSGAGQVEIH